MYANSTTTFNTFTTEGFLVIKMFLLEFPSFSLKLFQILNLKTYFIKIWQVDIEFDIKVCYSHSQNIERNSSFHVK